MHGSRCTVGTAPSLNGQSGGVEPVQQRLTTISRTEVSLEPSSKPLPPRSPDRSEIVGHKGSIFYRAHSYHTKVPPEGIARLIEHYTAPGDVVLDPFCGSGMTGVACRMTGRLGVLSDLSPAACHIASGYNADVEPAALKAAGQRLFRDLADLEETLYGTPCPSCHRDARVEYTVWSDVFGCPACESEILFWRDAVDPGTGAIAKSVSCQCGRAWAKRALRWLGSVPVLESVRCRYCRRVQRSVGPEQFARIRTFDRDAIKAWYPTTPFENYREMWRGQHGKQGIETAADFFTPRNLRALAETWGRINRESDGSVRDGLRFVFTASLNRASRRYQWNPKRPTNVLSSTLYIASLSYEFNVFSLLRRKLSASLDLFKSTADLTGRASVSQCPAQSLTHVPNTSVHYVFTDPPFGSNIFYADSSFLWEAWLGDLTDLTHEAVVHRSQRPEHGGKSLQDYEKLMTGAFEEVSRVLRPNGWASVMFHNSSDDVWSALERSIETAGFEVQAAVVFDKSQASFKGLKGQLAGERVPNFDLVLHIQRRAPARKRVRHTAAAARVRVEERLRDHVANAPPSRRSTAYLHSLAMRVLLEENLPIDGFGYAAVETLCAEMFHWDGAAWVLRPSAVETT
jgi:16S rRNA G966 N2-methylase RsmD